MTSLRHALLVASLVGCLPPQQQAPQKPEPPSEPFLIAGGIDIEVTPATTFPTDAEITAHRERLCSPDGVDPDMKIFLRFRYSDGDSDSYKCSKAVLGSQPTGRRFEEVFRQRFEEARARCKKPSAIALADVSPKHDRFTGYCDGRLVQVTRTGATFTENIGGGSVYAGWTVVDINVGIALHAEVPDGVRASSRGKLTVLEGPGFRLQLRPYLGAADGAFLIPRGTAVDEIAKQGADHVMFRSNGGWRFIAVLEFGDNQVLVESDPTRKFTRAQADKMMQTTSRVFAGSKASRTGV